MKKWEPEPCPFCGNTNIIDMRNDRRLRPIWWMKCSGNTTKIGEGYNPNACLAEGPLATTRGEARRLWNERVGS